jgi:CRISPR-associated protein Csx14
VSIRIRLDTANPGQFFACCGLLELADRLWRGAEGCFVDGSFWLRPLPPSVTEHSLVDLISAIVQASLVQLDAEDDFSSPIGLSAPFDLRLDWWKDSRAGGAKLKVWAGRMGSIRIARAMHATFRQPELQKETLLDHTMIVYDPLEPDKKVEPFYFDARRGDSAQAVDIGFSTDSLQMTTVAYPAVEFLCLVGLQRFRPQPGRLARVFEYCTWEQPLEASIASIAVLGVLDQAGGRRFRFENAFRTEQRKHKAFSMATQLQKEQP